MAIRDEIENAIAPATDLYDSGVNTLQQGRRLIPNYDINAAFYASSDPQYANLWQLQFFTIDYGNFLQGVDRDDFDIGDAARGFGSATASTASSVKESIEHPLTYNIKSTSLPFFGIETEKREIGSKHVSKPVFPESFDVVFSENNQLNVSRPNAGLKITTYMEEWFSQIYDYKNRIWKKGNNRRRAVLTLQRQLAGAYFPSAKYEIKGIIPTKINTFDLAYTDGEPLEVSVTFECEEIIRKF